MRWFGFVILAFFTIILSDFNFESFFSILFLSTIIVVTGIFLFILYASNEEKNERESQTKVIKNKTLEHIKVLYRKRQQGIIEDDYGNKINDNWLKAVQYFTNTTVAEFPGIALRLTGNEIFELIDSIVSNYQYPDNGLPQYSNKLSPIEFEEYCSEILNKTGWIAQTTKQTGDQGVDVIAKKWS